MRTADFTLTITKHQGTAGPGTVKRCLEMTAGDADTREPLGLGAAQLVEGLPWLQSSEPQTGSKWCGHIILAGV